MRRVVVALVVLLTASRIASAASTPGDAILGEWRGSSICLHRELAPACKDESVRYVFTRNDDSLRTYHLAADKLVAGKYELMGEMDFSYSTSTATWTSPLHAPRCPNCTWWFRLKGNAVVGGLTNDTGTALRKVDVRRVPRTPPKGTR